MDFTNATHGPGCHCPPGPRTCSNPTTNAPQILPLFQEPWRGINHRSSLYTHHRNHTHTPNTTAHTQRSRCGPTLKGQYFSFLHTRPSHGNSRNARLHPRSTFTHVERDQGPSTPHSHPQARVPTLQTGGCGQAADSGVRRNRIAGGSARSKPAPGPACPSRRGPGGKCFHAVVHRDPLGGKLGAGNTENPRGRFPLLPSAALSRSWRGGGGGPAQGAGLHGGAGMGKRGSPAGESDWAGRRAGPLPSRSLAHSGRLWQLSTGVSLCAEAQRGGGGA